MTTARPAIRALGPVDRALISLGCDPAFVSDVLGDLREEYAQRSAHDGIVAATWWYAAEIARSIEEKC